MRELIFKGKRLDNGEWVQGASVLNFTDNDETYIAKSGSTVYGDAENGNIVSLTAVFYKVDRVTVSQYTGVKDKNDKKIYEHDIVQAHFKSNRSKQTFIVCFEDGMFLFDNNVVKVPRYDIYALQVIGNIHDNPELLERGNNA